MKDNKYCDSCGYQTDNVKHYDSTSSKEGQDLCKICANTSAGNAFEYPNQYPDKDVLKTIAYTTNLILDKIKEKK